MSNKTFYGTLIFVCVLFATLFLAGDCEDGTTYIAIKAGGFALCYLAYKLYHTYKAEEAQEAAERGGER